jgi:hypothetical protein
VGEVAEVDVAQVGAAGRGRVRQQAAVWRDGPLRHRRGSVGRERVGVEYQDGPCGCGRLPVEHGLLLQPGVLAEPELAGLTHRDLNPRVIPQRREPLPDRVPPRDAVQIPEGDRVLGRDPRLGGLSVEVLQRAVGVGHRTAEVGIHDLGTGSGRVLELLCARLRRNHQYHSEREAAAFADNATAHGNGSGESARLRR